jgi:ketosteroid isomerase-like protein
VFGYQRRMQVNAWIRIGTLAGALMMSCAKNDCPTGTASTAAAPTSVASSPCPPAAPGREPVDHARDEQAIRTTIANYTKYINTGDIDGYASQYADDAFWSPPAPTPTLTGTARIAEAQRQMVQLYDIVIDLQVKSLNVADDVASVVVTSPIRISDKKGKPVRKGELSVAYILKRHAGDWKITHQVGNLKDAE